MLNCDLPAKPQDKKQVIAEWGVKTVTSIIGVELPGVSTVLEAVAVDVLNRLISDREASRVERVVSGATLLIAADMKSGREPRSDSFEGANPGNRKFSEEVAEGVLLSVQRENEERKLPFYQQFIRSYVFDPALDPASARTILALASDLSYRQCCILALASRQTLRSTLHYDIRLRVKGKTQHRTDVPTVWEETFMQEVFDLEAQHLVEISRGLSSIPYLVTLTSLGKVACDALGFSYVESDVLDALGKQADPVDGWLLTRKRIPSSFYSKTGTISSSKQLICRGKI